MNTLKWNYHLNKLRDSDLKTGRDFPEDRIDRKKHKQLMDPLITMANELIEEVGIERSYFLIFGEEMISPPVQDLPDK